MSVTKTCAHCGKTFDALRGNYKYCSVECALAVEEERQREYSRRYRAEHRERILAKKRRNRESDKKIMR